jgi:hypothetical protein
MTRKWIALPSVLLLLAALLAAGPPAHACPMPGPPHLTITCSQIGGAPVGTIHENFDTLLPGSASGQVLPSGVIVSFSGDAGIVQGSLLDHYAAPYISGYNGIGFGLGGSSQPNGPDTTPYLTSGAYGPAPAATGLYPDAHLTLSLPGMDNYFGLLWGTVDDFNSIGFYHGAALVATLTGAAVKALPLGSLGVEGTNYVNFTSATGFDHIVFTSRQWAFEFDNISFGPIISDYAALPTDLPIDEPGGLLLFGAALLALASLRPGRALHFQRAQPMA